MVVGALAISYPRLLLLTERSLLSEFAHSSGALGPAGRWVRHCPTLCWVLGCRKLGARSTAIGLFPQFMASESWLAQPPVFRFSPFREMGNDFLQFQSLILCYVCVSVWVCVCVLWCPWDPPLPSSWSWTYRLLCTDAGAGSLVCDLWKNSKWSVLSHLSHPFTVLICNSLMYVQPRWKDRKMKETWKKKESKSPLLRGSGLCLLAESQEFWHWWPNLRLWSLFWEVFRGRVSL